VLDVHAVGNGRSPGSSCHASRFPAPEQLKQPVVHPASLPFAVVQSITDAVLLAVATLTKVILAIILTLRSGQAVGGEIGVWHQRGVFDARNNNPSVTTMSYPMAQPPTPTDLAAALSEPAELNFHLPDPGWRFQRQSFSCS